MNQLTALTSLDGRYHKVTAQLQDIFSEYALIKRRVFVEIQWFKFLAAELKLFSLTAEHAGAVDHIYTEFRVEDAAAVKEIEKTTNHDVKAVEYFLKQKFVGLGLEDLQEWVHFSCTSADINNTAYALMLKEGQRCLSGYFQALLSTCEELAKRYKTVPMMSRTHGQPATPTTVGKEFVNFAWRIRRELRKLTAFEVEAKLNGATGNFNAHHFVYPNIDWARSSEKFLSEYLNVKPLLLTTQINPNNYISELLQICIRLSSTLIDLDRDVWGYISLGYFKQKLKSGEVGSSTMPHKVNPIDFENSEGNLGMAISVMEHLSVKLLNSRFQRDLTDSTVMRNMGAVFGYVLLGIKSSQKGMGKIEIDEQRIAADLNANWELLAEPFQTMMRVYGEENPYEKLKELTRGAKISQTELSSFVDGLKTVPDDVKARMKALTPAGYVGIAARLVDLYFQNE
ncbi:MAG: adenylosuccinate lyase [Candidatus Omnitrophica bacterium]|nr:adenylosuccinate lyase [Candidatus Omnitrophota bacterium]